MSKHTPGPWSAECRAVGYKGGEWGKDEFLQWVVCGPEVPSGRGQFFQADARLIAAAPDLLAALQVIASFAVGNGDVCEIIAQRARAAIAKATGGQDD